MNLNILVLPGDGIGTEVTREAVRVLRHVADKFKHSVKLTEGLLGGIAALSGPLVFMFLLAKGLSGRAFTKEASMFLVVSSALLASALASSRQFDWRDVLISTLATLPVVAGMLVGQRLRDIIPADAFEKLVVLTVLLSGAQLVWKGVSA